MRPKGLTLLLTALVAVAVLVLHELRYLIGYGAHAGEALASQGHAYLPLASAGASLLLALGVGQLLLVVRRALRTQSAGQRPPFGLLWLAATSALLVVYCSQELLEGVLASGHPDGIAALAANGGWSAIPLALGLGLLVALVLRGAAAAEALAARRRTARPVHASAARRPRPRDVERVPLPVLAAKLGGRAPPIVLAHPRV